MSRSKAPWRRRIGRVTVYRRGTRYWIYYRQGRQIRKPVGTNRDDALALAAKVNAQLAEGAPTLLAFQPIDVKGLIAKWLEHHEDVRRSSLATVRRYGTAARHLASHVDGAYGKIRADRFDSSAAERFVRYLRTIKVSPNGQANTKKRRMRDKGVVFVLGTCRALFNFAHEQRHLPAYAPNPFTGLAIERMPIEDAKPIRPLTDEQEFAFFTACDEWQFRIFFTLAFTGLRVGELTHLLIDNDLNLAADLVRVRNKPRVHWKVKTRNIRDIPLLSEAARVIQACVGERDSGPVFLRRRFAKGGCRPPLAGLSMPDLEEEVTKRTDEAQARSNRPLTRQKLARIGWSVWRDAGAIKTTIVRVEFMRVTERIGLAHLTCPKDLRHLFATSLQAAGVDPMVRRDMMGHTSLEMTAHYTHTQDQTRRQELNRLTSVRGDVLQLARGRLDSP